ncbi:MAG: DNA polymerase, partial [Patescibacteria group bacterium]
TLKKGINDTIIYDEKAVENRFGFSPKLVPDYKGLRGDPSDNIVGVRGIGEKTAGILIKKFGTVENIYRELAKNPERFKKAGISERLINILKENEEEAEFSKTLAEIRKDAPIQFSLPKGLWREHVDAKALEELLREFEFKSLYERVKGALGVSGGETATAPVEIDKDVLTEASIALWLIDSEKTNPDIGDILAFTREGALPKAHAVLLEEIKKRKLERVLYDIELPIVPIIRAAEARGVLVDASHFKKLSGEYHKKLSKLEKKIWEEAGVEFNINSPKQMAEVLFDKMNLSADKGVRLKKTEGGARSTRVSELEKLKKSNPIVEEILSYRELQKILSTYVDAIPPLLDSSGRLHTTFIQSGTTTGRFASTNPNLQNIPAHGEFGLAVRDGFIAAPGHLLISLDYSQIELRVAAMLSGDKNLTQIFKEGKDVHSAVASRVFHVAQSEVTSEMRRQAKIINFGIVYGMGVTALQENLGGTRVEAQEFYDNYMKEFKDLADYIEEVKKFAGKNGYTETLFGRRRQFSAIRSSIPYVRAMAERMAGNAPLQGTAADIIKIAIKLADTDLREAGIHSKTHLLLQIHDELIYEVEEGVLGAAEAAIKSAMESVLSRSFIKEKIGVPLSVNVAAGSRWGEI